MANIRTYSKALMASLLLLGSVDYACATTLKQLREQLQKLEQELKANEEQLTICRNSYEGPEYDFKVSTLKDTYYEKLRSFRYEQDKLIKEVAQLRKTIKNDEQVLNRETSMRYSHIRNIDQQIKLTKKEFNEDLDAQIKYAETTNSDNTKKLKLFKLNMIKEQLEMEILKTRSYIRSIEKK